MSGYAAGMVAAGGGNCCGSNKGCAVKRRNARGACCPEWGKGFFVILFVPNKKYVKVFKGFN